MPTNDFEIFDGKTFSGLMKDIYIRSDDKKDKIATIIDSLKGLIVTIEDAVSILPMIKECLDVGVKNDEQLVKMAAVIQRLVAARKDGEGSGDMGFDLEEWEEIKKNASEEVGKLRKIDGVVSEEVAELEESIKEKLSDLDEIDLEELEDELMADDLDLQE